MQQVIKSPFHDDTGELVKLLAIIETATIYAIFALFFFAILFNL